MTENFQARPTERHFLLGENLLTYILKQKEAFLKANQPVKSVVFDRMNNGQFREYWENLIEDPLDHKTVIKYSEEKFKQQFKTSSHTELVESFIAHIKTLPETKQRKDNTGYEVNSSDINLSVDVINLRNTPGLERFKSPVNYVFKVTVN